MRRDIAALILKHTRVTRCNLTPELSLRLITPECELWSARLDQIPFESDPFWGFYWPGGQAVSRFILDGGIPLEKRRVLDLGCGCGASAIAAAKMNAQHVLANDIDICALTATKINAELNKTKMATSSNNFIETNCDAFDTIFIGDMFYDEEFANALFDWLKRLACDGKTILIGDPGRHALTEKRREFLTLLATYVLPENSCLENRGFQEATVWTLNK